MELILIVFHTLKIVQTISADDVDSVHNSTGTAPTSVRIDATLCLTTAGWCKCMCVLVCVSVLNMGNSKALVLPSMYMS